MLLFGASAASAVDVDLTTAGASGTIGAGSFIQIHQQPTGTGVIDPFVRIQNNRQEQGFNSDVLPLGGDLVDVKPGPWTHSIKVSDLVPVTYQGVLSARFLLDINQTGANPLLSLDALQIYTAPTGDLASNASLFTQNLIYDMGAGNRVLLDFSLESGSGSGDMYFYLPYSLFAGLGDQFLYLYSEFGASDGDYASNDGYEEWAHLVFPVPVRPSTWSRLKTLFR
jgi:hypothetical protein